MRNRVFILVAGLAVVFGGALYFIKYPSVSRDANSSSPISRETGDVGLRGSGSVERSPEEPLNLAANEAPLYVLIAGTAAVALTFAWMVYRFASRRRRDLLLSPHLVTPENFHKWTGSVSGGLENFANRLLHLSEHIKSSQEAHRQSVVELSETFLTLNKALDQRDQQIRRAEQGWERQVFKRFLVRFAKVDQTLNDSLLTPPEVLGQARALMHDALSECDVHPLLPPIGSDYRKATGVADRPDLVPTNDQALFYIIKRVVTPGYRLSTPDHEDVIVIPAKVEVYSPMEKSDA